MGHLSFRRELDCQSDGVDIRTFLVTQMVNWPTENIEDMDKYASRKSIWVLKNAIHSEMSQRKEKLTVFSSASKLLGELFIPQRSGIKLDKSLRLRGSGARMQSNSFFSNSSSVRPNRKYERKWKH